MRRLSKRSDVFTVELKINGTLVAHLYGVNKGPVVSKETDDFGVYHYHYYDVSTGKAINNTIRHRRSEGLRNLVVACLEDADGKVEDEMET